MIKWTYRTVVVRTTLVYATISRPRFATTRDRVFTSWQCRREITTPSKTISQQHVFVSTRAAVAGIVKPYRPRGKRAFPERGVCGALLVVSKGFKEPKPKPHATRSTARRARDVLWENGISRFVVTCFSRREERVTTCDLAVASGCRFDR